MGNARLFSIIIIITNFHTQSYTPLGSHNYNYTKLTFTKFQILIAINWKPQCFHPVLQLKTPISWPASSGLSFYTSSFISSVLPKFNDVLFTLSRRPITMKSLLSEDLTYRKPNRWLEFIVGRGLSHYSHPWMQITPRAPLRFVLKREILEEGDFVYMNGLGIKV